MSLLHVHRRRVPTQNVFRSIAICAIREAAVLTEDTMHDRTGRHVVYSMLHVHVVFITHYRRDS